MANSVENISVGKPKIGGAIYRAPAGTELPTSALSELNSAFAALGYVSDDGVSNAESRDVDNIKAWGGDTILVVQSSKEDAFTFTLLESLNTAVLKAVHGEDNVTGSLADGITVKANATELEAAPWVIDMILKGDICKRIVIPKGQVSEVGDTVYKDDEPIGYEVTLTCLPDDSENTHYEYIQKKATTTGGGD